MNQEEKDFILSVQVKNHSGVLQRISGLFSRTSTACSCVVLLWLSVHLSILTTCRGVSIVVFRKFNSSLLFNCVEFV